MRSSGLVKEFAFPRRRPEESEQKMMKKQGSIQVIKKEAEGARCSAPFLLYNGRSTVHREQGGGCQGRRSDDY